MTSDSGVRRPSASVCWIALCAVLHFGAAPARSDTPTRPNLILIMADDLGYETIGANGGTSYRTPRLDQLAAEGVRFEHCYVQPLCTPTRVQLMTGQYNVRNYIRFGVLPPGSTTFANLLRDAGYATGIVGKWQLGKDRDLPRTAGFDEHCLWQHTRRPPRYANPGLEIDGVERDYRNGEYGPDLVNDYALDFITRHKDEPFLLYYPMILTHSPYQPTPSSKAWDPTAMGERVLQKPEHFGDMVEHVDRLVGRVVDRLRELSLSERTLLIFVGDNGTGRGTPSMMGERRVVGGKGTTTEAGMRVPLIVHWPGAAARGAVVRDLVDSTDFLPTLLEAAGVKGPESLTLDGRSFLPQVRGEAGAPRSWIYCWYSPRQNEDRTVREFAFNSQFKLYRDGSLYDLQSDPQEKRPLRGRQSAGTVAIRTVLERALDQYRDARPAALAP